MICKDAVPNDKTLLIVIFSSPDPPPDVEFLNPLYVQRHKDSDSTTNDSVSASETDTFERRQTATTNVDECETLLVHRTQHIVTEMEMDVDKGEIFC